MNIPNFHDGNFEGFLVNPNKEVLIFLRTREDKRYILALKSVQAMSISEVKAGNVIFDLVFREVRDLTTLDLVVLYDADSNSSQTAKFLNSLKERNLRIMELNASYGAKGLFLFERFEITERPGIDVTWSMESEKNLG
ncbi:MAG TPA: hypothetical protein VFI38_11260 [Candidatus Acidoferrum sp.]|nr:hypothetical protein [Candidatus Acidoferrum sp.]